MKRLFFAFLFLFIIFILLSLYFRSESFQDFILRRQYKPIYTLQSIVEKHNREKALKALRSPYFWKVSSDEEIMHLINKLVIEGDENFPVFETAFQFNRCDLFQKFVDAGLNLKGKKLANMIIRTLVLKRYECGQELIGLLCGRKDLADTMLDGEGNSLFHYVAEKGTPEMVRRLFSCGVPMDIRNKKGVLPIMYAVYYNSPEVLKAMLMLGSDPNAVDSYGQTTLILACEKDVSYGCEKLRILLEGGADPNYCPNVCPLDYAVAYGQLCRVKALLDYGASLTKKGDRWHYFKLAASYSRADVLDLLLSRVHGSNRRQLAKSLDFWMAVFDPKNKDVEDDIRILVKKYYFRPNMQVRWKDMDLPILSIACIIGNESAVRALVENGAYVDAGSNSQRPIRYAALGSNAGLVRYLIEKGASIYYEDKESSNLLTLLLLSSDKDLKRRLEVMRFLIGKHLSVNDRIKMFGDSVLMVALREKAPIEIVRLLIDAGALLNFHNELGFSPLMYSLIYSTDPEIVTLLLKRGAKVEDVTPDGMTFSELLQKNQELMKRLDAYKDIWRKYGLDIKIGEIRKDGDI